MAFVCFLSLSVRNRSCQRVLTHARVPRYLSCYLYFHQGKGKERGGLRGRGGLLTSLPTESGRSALPDVNVFIASCKRISPLLKNIFLLFSTLTFLVYGFYLLLHAIQANLTLTRFGKTLFAISDMYLLFQWVFKYFSLCINAVHCLKMPASALICRL